MFSSTEQDVIIPIIDISNPSAEVAKQVLDAASTHGFLFIKNDAGIIPTKDIAGMFELVSYLYQNIYHVPPEIDKCIVT
jgi:hypothetical protein